LSAALRQVMGSASGRQFEEGGFLGKTGRSGEALFLVRWPNAVAADHSRPLSPAEVRSQGDASF